MILTESIALFNLILLIYQNNVFLLLETPAKIFVISCLKDVQKSILKKVCEAKKCEYAAKRLHIILFYLTKATR